MSKTGCRIPKDDTDTLLRHHVFRRDTWHEPGMIASAQEYDTDARSQFTLAQQGPEAGLLEVVVACQGVGDAVVRHDEEGDAIGEAPCLVGARAIKGEAAAPKGRIRVDQGRVLVGLHRLEEAEEDTARLR